MNWAGRRSLIDYAEQQRALNEERELSMKDNGFDKYVTGLTGFEGLGIAPASISTTPRICERSHKASLEG